jgi:uracil-DNA glycosylase family 4
MDAVERAAALRAYAEETASCIRCALAHGRTQVVFGSGSPNAELMFVGEAPGFHEDQQGVPFVGQAGKLLDKLLAGIELTRADVFVANVLKCLKYTAQVQLGDGSWERIGRLVSTRYSGTVMSVDAEGRLVERRVVGWHATPRGARRVFKLTYRSAKRAGLARVAIELTGDHPVLTERGYVPAAELRDNDRVATGQGLSTVARDVVCGTVLGDGHLNRASAHLFFAHSARQTDYATFKAAALAELDPRIQHVAVAAVSGGAPAYPVIHVRTLAHRALGVLRNEFYDEQKRVPEWIADGLTDRMLAIWFMDDGYTRIREGGRQPLAEIATVGFNDDDLQILLRGLAQLDLPAKALRGRLYFDVATTRALSERIAPYVPPSMRYKLHPEVAERTPFQPERFAAEKPVVMFDQVDVEDVTDRHVGDQTFFCIDVEATGNFVTAGGVVHNCRPPGNRDPLPEEIASCEPHLFRQIEIIEPKLVATLGNFATKLLSGKPAGITKVHGYEQEVTLGARTVLLYPLYHPAAALYTPSMLKVLEEDFARIPALLERSVDEPTEAHEAVVEVEQPDPESIQLGLF